MRILETKDTWASVYDSVDEALRHVNSPGSVKISSRNPGGSFQGSKTWEDAVKLIRYGDSAVGNKITEQSNKIASSLLSKTHHPDIAYDVQGQVIDMGRYVDGVPDCVLNMDVPDTGTARTCEIVVNMTCNCSVKSEEILNRGVTIASIIKTIEAKGVSCRLWICYCFQKSGGFEDIGVSSWIKFKEYGEPLRLNQLAFMACHPSSLRRFGFALAEQAPEKLRDRVGISNIGGYGYASNKYAAFGAIPVNPHLNPKIINFKIADNQPEFKSIKTAQKYVADIISKK